MTAFETTPVARKSYPCARKSGCVIQPGERHVREATAPWTLLVDDPEPPYFPIGEWWVVRFHAACDHEWRYA